MQKVLALEMIMASALAELEMEWQAAIKGGEILILSIFASISFLPQPRECIVVKMICM